MALLKNIQYPNGTETNYHKIGEIRVIPQPDKIDYVEKVIEPVELVEDTTSENNEEMETLPPIEYEEIVTKMVSVMVQVLSYVSQEIRDTGVKNNLTSQISYFNLTMEQLSTNDIMTVCYGLIKTLPEFEGAENV